MAEIAHGSSRISEAFAFLKEYQQGTVFDETKTEDFPSGRAPNGVVNAYKGLPGNHHKNGCDGCLKMDEHSSDPNSQRHDLKTVTKNDPINCLKNHCNSPDSKANGHMRNDRKVSTKEEIKVEESSQKLNSSGASDNSYSLFDKENCSEDGKVLMRKKSSKVGKDETKTNHMVSGSCQTEAEPTIGRPVEVVSDIFHFLTETEGELNGDGRESGIPRPGNEDKIFNKLLIIDETQEKHKEQSGNSSVGHFNGCITDGVCNTDGPNMESDRNSSKPQGNVTDHSMENSEDSSDDDTGIYNESYRKSVWLCMPDEKSPNLLQSSSIAEEEPESDEVFIRGIETKLLEKSHKRTDSTTTTCSESEFKHEYRLRRKCMVHRHDSQQEYQRMSAKVYEHEQLVVIYKDGKDRDFGLHIFDSHPAFITEVDHGSPAQRAGLKAGQVLLSVNGVNVLELSHQEIIKLVQKDSNIVKLEVASSDVHYVRNQQTPVMSGYMYKQSNSTFVKNWRRRYFVLRFDNCLYYYKGEQDQDPLGAIPLLNYIVSKQTDSSREHYFKAEKFGARTYYFIADSRVEMIKWVSSLNEAATRAKEKKDAWMDVTASNVGLPALDIKKPDCFGYLSKCGRTVRTWRKRYCVLKDACIYYYKNINSSSAQGMAHLHGYKVENMTSSLRKHGFVLRPPEPQMRTFSFCAENETHKERWMAALEKSIQRWIKVD